MGEAVSANGTVEAPSGKDAAYENFPVGSWLLPASTRPHVATFYAFARTIDDIADSPDLSADQKVERLDGFADAVRGDTEDPAYAKGVAMRLSLDATGVDDAHCLDLVKAFKQDAVKHRYDDWDDLMGYCYLSASPVGRYLIDLHGGSRHGYGPSDALCNALQVLNHLQDCRDDYLALDRVYLPGDWLAAEGASVEELAGRHASPALRRVIDRALDATSALLAESRALPGGLASRRLAMESAVIVDIAFALADKLRRHDPLARRVVLSKPRFLWCGVKGVLGRLV